MSETDPAYETFWKRKKLLKETRREFPLSRWWDTDVLCDIEQVYFDAVRHAPRLLDVGAGDLRVMHKLQRAGYRGEYHTQDVGQEGVYTFRNLAEVEGTYGAVLCLDVIEHLPLRDGLLLLKRIGHLLSPGGVLILQTPNAHYIPEPRSWDMTHLHTYNVSDLWAHLTCDGFEVSGYRVVFAPPGQNPIVAVRSAIAAFVKKKVLGCDYANNIALIVRKPGESSAKGPKGSV